MARLFANSEDPDQTPHSDLRLHCLPITLLGVSQLQRGKAQVTPEADNILIFFFVFFRKIKTTFCVNCLLCR